MATCVVGSVRGALLGSKWIADSNSSEHLPVVEIFSERSTIAEDYEEQFDAVLHVDRTPAWSRWSAGRATKRIFPTPIPLACDMTHSTVTPTSWPVLVETADATLSGDLTIPEPAGGLVVFAHGSGSSRRSPRNRAVAEILQHAHVATLLLDLLTESEERADAVTAEFRFDISLLASRVTATVDWCRSQPTTASLALGLFGASTGAAAALMAAAERPARVRAVVSRGGRPDLADAALEVVAAPTLLIVGGHDQVVIQLNQQALERMPGVRELRIVPGATHLFEEAGALEQVARLATDWFLRYLS